MGKEKSCIFFQYVARTITKHPLLGGRKLLELAVLKGQYGNLDLAILAHGVLTQWLAKGRRGRKKGM